MGSAVAVRDLRMRYGSNDVLTGVDFDVHADEVVCLLEPNGAGKTTTIEILEGFRIRSAGEVTVLGQDPAHADEDCTSGEGSCPCGGLETLGTGGRLACRDVEGARFPQRSRGAALGCPSRGLSRE